MKKLNKFVIATVLLAGTHAALAGSSPFVSADGSALSGLCVAAAASPANLHEFALEQGISRAELDSIRCNDISIRRFVLKYGDTPLSMPTADDKVAYVLKKADASPLTALCAAAAVSSEALDKVKDELFSTDSSVESEVFCNGVPLKSFARRFRDVDKTLVTQL